MTSEEVVLDEIQWRAPPIVQELGGIHENTGQLQSLPFRKLLDIVRKLTLPSTVLLC